MKWLFGFSAILLFTSCESESDNSLPEASFNYIPQEPVTGEVITFNASSSSDQDGVIVAYDWNFGDGEVGVGEYVTHFFDEEGTYDVTLNVTDDKDGTSIVTVSIFISSALILVEQVSVPVVSPSGLVLADDKQSLWTVSDKPGGGIYQVSMTGDIISSIPYYGSDLEGITLNYFDSSFWVVEEASGDLVHVDNNGDEVQRVAVSGSTDGSGGLEGISVRPEDRHFFILKEKDPGVLIELDDEFNLVQYNRLYFADDYAGIDYDPAENTLWIVSDQNQKVYKCDTSGNVLKYYSIALTNMEGIAVNVENKSVYLVNDEKETLYVYSLKE